jgi:hypothetical protein
MRHWTARHGANGIDARSYAVFRWALGAYLLVHFAQLVAFGPELFSSRGVLPDADASPVLRLFPNVLALWDSPSFVTALLVAATALAAAVALGAGDRVAAIGCWYVLACLYGRNPLIANPSLPYVGWLLLAHALFGPSRAERSSHGWRLPAPVFASAWLVMAAGYSYAGITKLASPSWLDGTALVWVLENPLARAGTLRAFLLDLPQPVLRAATWGALVLELAFLPVSLVVRLRAWLWLAMASMHVGLIVLIDFAELSTGMLLLHLYTFDPAWLSRAVKDRVALGNAFLAAHGRT